MDYPSLREYKAAISDTNNINIPFFKSSSIKIFLNKRGMPYMSVGGFGAVFQFKDKNDKQYALKVFTRDARGRAKRYQGLHDTLQITKFPFMVDFHYVQDGLKVGKQYYPVVVMEWGQGIPLDRALENDLADDGIVQSAPTVAGNLYLMTKTLQEWKMGHGDFQEGNLLIGNDDRITLIDYDGMYIPALEGEKANEIGLADYQHPKRDNDSFGTTIDDFSLISILFQLSIIDKPLWDKHHAEKRLLLTQDDYTKAKKSPLVKKALKSKDAHVKALAELFVAACAARPLEINAIEAIEKNTDIMAWLSFTEITAPTHNFTSVIKEVVSLTDQQVQDFESDKIQLGPEPEQQQAAEEKQPPRKIRKDDKTGTWETIIGFLYEDDGDTDEDDTAAATAAASSRTGDDKDMLGKVKNKVMDLLFEEDTRTKQKKAAAQQQAATTAPAQSVPVQSEDTDPATTAEEEKPAVSEKMEKKEKKPPEDSKTAPLPDWMKKRKGK